ncbi:hypothetical protein F5Y16DRAFT_392874 [Xylariaceae sp. FL0255]|nr:hypothetical protein F5Y16DRAFT_392874 [Xylariaceae sp. FL0255]
MHPTMGDSPRHREMQGDSAAHQSSQPIYDAAQLCTKHFQHHLETIDGAGNDYIVIEELWGRFNQWAAYVGAFAVPRASLDARLAPHGDIREMVLELLYMIQDNLIWVKSRDNAGETSESSPGVPAVKAAVERLLILSVNIRRSARQSHRLRQGSRDTQDESLCRLLAQTRYPNARRSLCSQLGASIHARGISLQYMQEHNKKLAYRRNDDGDLEILEDEERPKEQVNAPVVPINKDTGSEKQKTTPAPETLPSVVSPSAIVRINRTKRNPSSTVMSSGSTVRDGQRNDYDYPPQPGQKDGKRYQACGICAMPLETQTLTKRAWNIHVDQDIEPYVCISEDCIEPPQYFTSLQDWTGHMQTRHSMSWSEQIHTERWHCDVDHNEPGRGPPEFDEKAKFLNHLNTCHGDKLTQSQILGRVRRNRRIATRDPFVCPLCDCVPPDIEKRARERPYKLLWEHIAQHLKSLAFLSLSYIGGDLEDKESIADSSAKASDENDARISKHSLSNISHHLYCDRDSCDCNDRERNSTLDWSSPEAIFESTVRVPIDEDQLPTSHDDPGYTLARNDQSEWEFWYPLSLPPNRKRIGPPEYKGHAKDEKLMEYFQRHPTIAERMAWAEGRNPISVMRLLTRKDSHSFSLTDYPAGSVIPPYAILSHTWGTDEITYEDLKHGTGLRKSGYQKLRFCGAQAERDGFRHFWVDTCCIDKSSSAELTESINSMFRWYGSAAKCYVYLDDVCCPATGDGDQSQHQQIRQQLRESRWFTRGWTLQELIAPKTVEFFSKEGAFLGDKESLEQPLCDITGIPARALRGDPLPSFTVAERMAWVERRETTRPEDRAYSLLGIFHVQMPLIYGEGEQNASRRLREEITKSQKDFSIPFSLYGVPEIEYFVAREQELAEMRNALTSDGSRGVVILHGLGGMGKTQLAIEYTKQYRDNYSAIFWLNIKDEDSLKQSFAGMAHLIKRYYPLASRIGSIDIQKDLDETIDAVKAWLSLPNNSRWLLVYDNYDNPKLPSNMDPAAIDIRKYFPESYHGSIVITTRSSRVKIGHAIRMSKIRNLDDSLEILATTSKREGLNANPDAVGLAKKLDGLPLALATAGAYLEQSTTTFRSYLRLYEESWAKLQISSPELSSYEDRTFYSTWQLSFDQIRRQNEHSASLLRLWAYFDNQDLWFELLQHGDARSPQWTHEVTKDELTFHNTVRVLRDYGLVEINLSTDELIESKGYNIHSYVHSWTTHVLNQETNTELAAFAIRCIASHVSGRGSSNYWLTQRRLLPHAARNNQALLDTVVNESESWIYGALGNLYSDQGKLREAEQMFQRALRGYEKALGPDHTSTLDSIHCLGSLYRDQGKLSEAEEMYQRALRGKEKALGPDHMSTLDTVNNLGNLYSDQGKLSEAEEIYQRALRGYEKALGPYHPRTQAILKNLQGLSTSSTSTMDQSRPDSHNSRTSRLMRKFKTTLNSKKK